MKAMILAAGLGSRLRPLTDTAPKALIKVGGKPLLEHQILRLKKTGVREIIVNTHHLANQVEVFLHENDFGVRIEISHEDKLLDTGGGLKKASWFFDDGQPFLLHNVDVLTDIDYRKLLDAQKQSTALATLAVRQRDTERYFLFDDRNWLAGWENVQSGEVRQVRKTDAKLQRLSFMGIHVISPQLFDYFPADNIFSIIDLYLELAGQDKQIFGYRAGDCIWLDVGKPEQLEQARQDKRFHHS